MAVWLPAILGLSSSCFVTVWVFLLACLMTRSRRYFAALSALGLGCYTVHYVRNVCQKPELTYTPSPFWDSVLSELPVLRQDYRPTPWCYSSHLQTLLPMLFRYPVHVDFRRCVSHV